MDKLKRRPNLAKEVFLEGNRQRWCAIFTVIGLLILISTSYGWLKDPAPFLQFFLSIGVTFILGASASDVMKSWKVDSSNFQESTTKTTIETTEKNVNIKEDITQKIDETYTEHIIIDEDVPNRNLREFQD